MRFIDLHAIPLNNFRNISAAAAAAAAAAFSESSANGSFDGRSSNDAQRLGRCGLGKIPSDRISSIPARPRQ